MASAGAGSGAKSGASSTAGARLLQLRFIFANHDGVSVEMESEPTVLIKDLKLQLAGRWPEGRVRGRDAESTDINSHAVVALTPGSFFDGGASEAAS